MMDGHMEGFTKYPSLKHRDNNFPIGMLLLSGPFMSFLSVQTYFVNTLQVIG